MKHRSFETLSLTTSVGHQLVGSLGGAPRAQKDNKRAQRSAQVVQKSTVECKGKSWFDVICASTKSQCESRA